MEIRSGCDNYSQGVTIRITQDTQILDEYGDTATHSRKRRLTENSERSLSTTLITTEPTAQTSNLPQKTGLSAPIIASVDTTASSKLSGNS